ncbi:mycofactocin-coupled SDR family oxidoreductase [Nocardia sp. CA2R105]|uniref:mycofactocin-coupled SDR family oxidoreductase n=1 Tax=Nocardia coffeae TaxID=2873381 RepID=UPI001CA79F55|nr:mycofactocin-coupled SDR family oxidoreductase [Nocardia coffeae]MBY8858653.1 mycofactocin-coupled SDR family oxidoreductase [Nocardia coffeae]
MGLMDGRVVLITGAARGQGRSHAIRFAEEGADVVAIDVCAPIPHALYPMGTADELAETAHEVEKLDRRCLTYQTDARDSGRLRQVVAEAVGELGRLDTVLINHGIARPHTTDDEDTDEVFDTLVEVNLSAVWRTATATIPYLKENGGGSIQVTGSAASLVGIYNNAGYTAAKHGLVGLVRCLAADLSPFWIRCNLVCPTNVPTPLMMNESNLERFVPDNPNATFKDMEFPLASVNQLPLAWVEPRVISDAMLFLAADTGKYITGISLPVDAGMTSQPPGITHFLGKRLAELAQAAGTTVGPAAP